MSVSTVRTNWKPRTVWYHSAIARQADVSAATIYQAFGTKQAIVERALDVTIAGDDAPVAILDRPWVDEVRREPDVHRRLTIVVVGMARVAGGRS